MTDTIPDLIARKRDGNELTDSEIGYFVYSVETMDPAQIGAFLMACRIHGLSENEIASLTERMAFSGEHFKPKKGRVDKHSTGGVGDKMSIILAPILAAHGLTVPMLAGRGLAHTGGTIDKLESIPGFITNLTMMEMENNPCFISCQTDEIAPTDRILYPTRDITATVDQIGLITASIVSKKVAEGLEKLVLDVKCGEAAFMKTKEEAIALAESMVKAAKALEVETVAQVTRMDNPIGNMIGNAHEIAECIDCLWGSGPYDTMELVEMQARALGVDNVYQYLKDGSAIREFKAMCMRQGVSEKTVEMLCADPWSVLDRHPERNEIRAYETGYLSGIDAMMIGRQLCKVGAGRLKQSDDIDHSIGIEILYPIGTYVKQGDVLAYYDGPRGGAELYLAECFKISEQPIKLESRLIKVID